MPSSRNEERVLNAGTQVEFMDSLSPAPRLLDY